LALLAGCAKPERQQVAVTLKNGETFVGTLETRDDKTVTILTPAGEAKTFLARQISRVETQKATDKKPAPEAPKPVAAAATAPASLPKAEPPPPAANFAPPSSGKIALAAGTAVNIRVRDGIDGGAAGAEYGAFVNASTLDDIRGEGGVVIPANSPVTLFAMAQPGTRGREIRFLLFRMFPSGRAYRALGPESSVSSTAEHSPLLGTVTAPPEDALPANLRAIPLRVNTGRALEFKLAGAVTLQETPAQ
jgi:small nuclear ribonucleoprotein (snRNP)-like protein